MANRDFVNKAILCGTLGRDAECKYTQSGTAVANFSIATSKSFKERDSDEWKGVTQWHNIVAWKDLAEDCAELSKGDRVFVVGEIEYQSWDDRESGETKYKTVIKAETVQKVYKRPKKGGRDGEDGGGSDDRGSSGGGRRGGNHAPASRPASAPAEISDEDIPF